MASAYCTKTDIEAIYGTANVATWAKMADADTAEVIAARIANAIAVASDDLDEALRCITGYESKLPIATVPPNVKDKVAMRAGLWLYDTRATEDYDKDNSYPAAKAKEYRRWLAELQAGKRKLDLG